MNNYQVAIFDFDGTLCDSEDAITNGIKETFQHFKKQAPSDTHIETVMSNGVGLIDTLKMLNPQLMSIGESTLKNWVNIYREVSKDTTRPMYDNAAEVIEQLKKEQVKIIIVSNNSEENIKKTLKENQIEKDIDLILGVSDQYPLKPHPDIFNHHVLPQYASFPLNDFIMVGDTATDIQFSQNVGIDSCWARYGIGHEEDCQALGPNYTVSDITAVVPILLGTKSHISR